MCLCYCSFQFREEVAYDTAEGVVVLTSPACDEVELEQKDVWRPPLST